MNILDVLIIAIVVSAIVRGLRIGLLRQIMATGGFIVGLLAGSIVARFAAQGLQEPVSRFLVILVVCVITAGILLVTGDTLGLQLRKAAQKVHIGKLDEVLGGFFEACFVLLIFWFLGSALANVRTGDIGSTVRGSAVIRQLNSIMPTPPDILASLEKVINPNTFPGVFVGEEPNHGKAPVPLPDSIDPAVIARAEASVVKIEGKGCGGIIDGSGFVPQAGYVITNAHVIAGVDRPTVMSGSKTYRARAIWFDPDLDFAVLQVNNLPTPVLDLSSVLLPDESAGVIIGYPNGGPLYDSPAVVIDDIYAVGRNIYNRGIVRRHIYELSTDIEQGNSGGPLISADGTAHGVVFGKSLSQPNIGYALTGAEVLTEFSKATTANTTVATGQCTNE